MIQLPNGPGRLISIHNRHHDIHQYQVKFIWIFLKQFHSFLSIPGWCDDGSILFQEKRGNLQIQFIIFHKQNLFSLNRRFRTFFFHKMHFFLCIYLKWHGHYEPASLIFPAVYFYGSMHLIQDLFHNRHSKPCSLVFTLISFCFPGKWLEHLFLKFLAHADSIVFHRNPINNLLICHAKFIYPRSHHTACTVILDCIRCNIHQHLLHMHRTSNHMRMRQWL